ncbi:MAG: helix-turn-helix transcriptional regulator [Clostridiales bacterium]|jgi:DNA-binding Xre family transcriptional regulator|nr:helix-turn-helix transcriptional regulator [Clostridiales bacterium]
MKLQEAVAIRLTELLVKKNMTRYSLCRKIAMNESTVYNIINGRCKSINMSTLFLIAHGLDITPCEFLDNAIFDKDKIEID